MRQTRQSTASTEAGCGRSREASAFTPRRYGCTHQPSYRSAGNGLVGVRSSNGQEEGCILSVARAEVSGLWLLVSGNFPAFAVTIRVSEKAKLGRISPNETDRKWQHPRAPKGDAAGSRFKGVQGSRLGSAARQQGRRWRWSTNRRPVAGPRD